MSDFVASDANDDRLELISFLVRDEEYCIDIKDVLEIRAWTPTTPVPSAPPHVRGVINLRGKVIAVVDLGAQMGLPLTEPGNRHVIIVVAIGGERVGLLVDAVCETLRLGALEIQPTPSASGPGAGGFVRGFISLEGRMVTALNLDRETDGVAREMAA